jgi:hypothetical protein
MLDLARRGGVMSFSHLIFCSDLDSKMILSLCSDCNDANDKFIDAALPRLFVELLRRTKAAEDPPPTILLLFAL